MAVVLHLLARADWEALDPDAPVTNPTLATEGFIHCTDDPEVLLLVANEFYKHLLGDFVVLHVDTDRLTSTCVWEPPVGPGFAALFPDVYGPIDRAAVCGLDDVLRDADGSFGGYEARNT